MASLLFARLLILLSAVGVFSLPLEPLPGKSGEDQVREAVRKAEEAAKKAAEESAKHGDNAAELRVAAIKAKLAAQNAIKQRVHSVSKLHPKLKSIRKWGRPSNLHTNLKQFVNHKRLNGLLPLAHRRLRRPLHRNAYSHMINLNELAKDGAPQNNYQEDTALEDRLALEAEEDKKIGSQYPEDSDYSFSRSSLSGRDATQSIQNQVARESARELKEIQQQINAESQNSLGKTTMGDAAAMFHNPSPQSPGVQQKPQTRNGMMELQDDLNHALTNADSMNNDPRLLSSQLNSQEGNSIGGNTFTGLGEERSQGDIESNIAGMASMQNSEQVEPMGDGQASMEGPQGDSIQSAASALAAGAGQTAFGSPHLGMSNDVGGLGGPTGLGEQAGITGLGGPAGIEGGNLGNGALEAGSLGPEASSLGGAGGMMLGGNSVGAGSMKKSKINKSKARYIRDAAWATIHII